MKIASILVTAGPTREKIDPVRFISNYSTGTFGYAIAEEAAKRGIKVTLVSGPTAIKAPKVSKLVRVESALDMLKAVLKGSRAVDCVIMAAAVSDWRPASPKGKKIKRSGSTFSLKLVQNPDILKTLGKNKKGTLVGFALETDDLGANAVKKLKDKNLDIIVANKLDKKTALFGNNNTSVTILDKQGKKVDYKRKTKAELAKIILDKVSNFNI